MAEVTFLQQKQPVDEYGRALYAVARSILRALLDQLGTDDLTDLGVDRQDVTLRQLSKLARLDRDKGLRGDGFEWAVHEAIMGGEWRVIDLVSDALWRASRRFPRNEVPESVLFGHERSRYLGFLDAVIENAGEAAVLLPDGRGHPFAFDTWVKVAARGKRAEDELRDRIKQVWKTDLFLSTEGSLRYVAATIKSNWRQLEGGRGLRIGIVPEAKDLPANYLRQHAGLHIAVLPDPNGFMGVFNDAYMAMAAAITTLGKHDREAYYLKPSAAAQRVQEQLEKYPTAKVVDIEGALDEAAQQDLLGEERRLVSVHPPPWLHINEHRATAVIAPRPRFDPL